MCRSLSDLGEARICPHVHCRRFVVMGCPQVCSSRVNCAIQFPTREQVNYSEPNSIAHPANPRPGSVQMIPRTYRSKQ